MNYVVTNRHNGKKYRAIGQYWPEHGWHLQILDPGAWGRSTTGIGDGPVIDQGWEQQLRDRGWDIPELGTEFDAREYTLGRSMPPKDIRAQEMKRLAQGLMKKPAQEAIDPNVPVRPRFKVPPPEMCECGDPGCPCGGHCNRPAVTNVFRIDMEDQTGTPMCRQCAEDAENSGIFYTKESAAFQVVDKLINEDASKPASELFGLLKPKAKVKVSRWEKSAGQKVEREHTNSSAVADTIASQHHAEDKDYYKHLKAAGMADELPKPKASFYPSSGGPSSV